MRSYVIIYFSILFARYRSGIVTDEMIGLPKSRFVAIGALEALGVASGMAAAGTSPFFIFINIKVWIFFFGYIIMSC